MGYLDPTYSLQAKAIFDGALAKKHLLDHRHNPLLLLHLAQAISIPCVEVLLLRVESEFFG